MNLLPRPLSYPLCRWARPRWGSPSSWWCCTCWRAVALLSAGCAPPSRWGTSPSSSRRPETAARRRASRPGGGTGCRVPAGRTAAGRRSTPPRSVSCSPPRTSRSYCPLSPSLQLGSRRQTLSPPLKQRSRSAPARHPARGGHWFNFRTQMISCSSNSSKFHMMPP